MNFQDATNYEKLFSTLAKPLSNINEISLQNLDNPNQCMKLAIIPESKTY